MEKLIRTLKRYKKEILKVGTYLVLLVIFIQFYFMEAYKNYLKGGTTFHSIRENVKFLPSPYITLCFNPPFKSSMLKKYGLTLPIFFKNIRDGHFNVSSKWELYQKLTFEHNKDFDIRLKYKDSHGSQELKFEIKNVATYRHGMCFTISQNISLSTEDGILKLYVDFLPNLLIEDVPQNVHFWLTNPTGWYGIVFDDWPLIKPLHLKIPIDKAFQSYWVAKFAQTDYYYMQGTEDFEKCLHRQITMKSSDCVTKCFPILYNFLPNLPPCNTTEEVNCNFGLIARGSRKKRYTCLKLQKDVKYDGNIFLNSKSEGNFTKIGLLMYFESTKDVKKEILMVPTADFIGSIGGSLGLFLGFSLFTYVSGMLDKLLP